MHALHKLVPTLSGLARPGRVGPIGLELAADRLHLVQMNATGSGLSIRAAVSIPYLASRDSLIADPAAFAAFVKRALVMGPFKGRRVVSCLPAEEIKIQLVNYRQGEGQSEAEAIVKELLERMPAELDESVLDYLPIRGEGSDTHEKTALVAVARRTRVLAYLDLLRRAGLEAQALDIGPAALARLVGAVRGDAHPNVLVINFGRAKTYLTVLWGRRLMLDREIEFGENTLLSRLGKTLNLTEDHATKLLYDVGLGGGKHPAQKQNPASEELAQTVAEILYPEFTLLANEVNKTLIYTASKTRGNSVEKVYLLGSVARYPHAAKFMQELFSIPVERFDPLAAFASATDAVVLQGVDSHAAMAVATGLALRGMGSDG